LNALLVEPDGSFHRFTLGKKQFLVILPTGVEKPVIQQIACDPAGYTLISVIAPIAHLLSYLIDQILAVIGTQIIQVENVALPLIANRYLRRIRRKNPPAFADIAVIEIAMRIGSVMTGWFVIRAVEYGIVCRRFAGCHDVFRAFCRCARQMQGARIVPLIIGEIIAFCLEKLSLPQN
jgi:hypothetical protein